MSQRNNHISYDTNIRVTPINHKDLIGDETKEFKELCQEIAAVCENDNSDATTINNDASSFANHNYFEDNIWTNKTNKIPLTKSLEIQQKISKEIKSDKSHSTTSLRIPNGNYTFYPKKMTMPNTISSKNIITDIDIPLSDSEDEACNEDYEYINRKHNEQQYTTNQYPFNLSSSINSNFYQSFSSTSDTNLNISQGNINLNNNSIERKMPYMTPINNNQNTSIQFNQCIRPPFNMSQTPNATSSFSFLNLAASYPGYDINNVFPTMNNHPYMIHRKKTQQTTRQETSAFNEQNDYTIDVEKIIIGNERRTTVMIKHIPVKYTSQSLISEIELSIQNTFDLFYLPMDFNVSYNSVLIVFKNKGNLGYAFINFIDPLHIVHFFKCFKGEKWKEFNSQKECDLSFARFQGKDDLIAHLEKSSQKTKEEKKALLFKRKKPFPRFKLPNVSHIKYFI